MQVTVCELSDNEFNFLDDWEQLIIHLNENKPDLLLLPEMPFCKWIASSKNVNHESKIESVEKHEIWISRIEQLDAKQILYSRPILSGDRFFNSAFLFERKTGHSKIHTKS